MKKLFLLASLAVLLAMSAVAGPVSFNTSGVFTCSGCTGSGTSAITIGGVTLTYNSANLSVTAPTGTQLGSFTVSGGTSLASLSGVTFTLTVNMTAPAPTGSSPNPANVSSTLSGTIASNNVAAWVFFSGTNFTANGTTGPGVQFTTANFQSPVNFVIVNADAGGPNGGKVGNVQLQAGTNASINAQIQDAPEPMTMTLVGAGLGIAGLLRLRRKA